MRDTCHTRAKAHHHQEDAAALPNDRVIYRAAENGSTDLRRAIDAAITRQACAWRIRPDQAKALLLDWRVVA